MQLAITRILDDEIIVARRQNLCCRHAVTLGVGWREEQNSVCNATNSQARPLSSVFFVVTREDLGAGGTVSNHHLRDGTPAHCRAYATPALKRYLDVISREQHMSTPEGPSGPRPAHAAVGRGRAAQVPQCEIRVFARSYRQAPVASCRTDSVGDCVRAAAQLPSISSTLHQQRQLKILLPATRRRYG